MKMARNALKISKGSSRSVSTQRLQKKNHTSNNDFKVHIDLSYLHRRDEEDPYNYVTP
jgi:hypothetical protein